jgi:hypothetical protein
VNRERIRVDCRVARDQASCCGVNLAFTALEVFSKGRDVFCRLFRGSRLIWACIATMGGVGRLL